MRRYQHLQDVLWIAYGTVMLLALEILISSSHWHAAVPLLLLTVVFMGLFLGLKRTLKHFSFVWIFAIYLVLAVLFFFIFHLSIFVLAIAGLAFYFILSWWDEDKGPELMWETFFGFLLFCVGAIVLQLSYLPAVPLPYAYLIFAAVEFILMNGILALQSQERGQAQVKPTSLFIGIFFGGIMVAGGILWLLRPIIQWILLKIVDGLAYAVFYTVSKVMSWVLPSHPSMSKQKRLQSVFHFSKQKNAKDIIHKSYETPSYFLWFGLILGAVIIVWLAVFFWKRRVKQHETIIPGSQAFTSQKHSNLYSQRRRNFLQAPSHPVRKEIFQLQKWANKHKSGRKFNETLRDWLGSKQLSFKAIQVIHSSYEKVRYGRQDLSPEEFSMFHEAVSEVKKELKQQSKKVKSVKRGKGDNKSSD